jgi:hypothetical protein
MPLDHPLDYFLTAAFWLMRPFLASFEDYENVVGWLILMKPHSLLGLLVTVNRVLAIQRVSTLWGFSSAHVCARLSALQLSGVHRGCYGFWWGEGKGATAMLVQL